MMTGRAQYLFAIGIICLFAAVSFYAYHDSEAPDFFATWMAGKMWGAGELSSIYPDDPAGVFRLLAPRSWYETLVPEGHYGEIYPFIYPPIWAVFSNWLAQFTDFATLNTIASAVNPVLLSLCTVLAWRITGRATPLVNVLIFGQLIFLTTWIGQLALLQNQPQILVAFLTLLAIERARSDAPISAGAALALAAAIKLYPALFVILFLGAGHRRAAAWFVLFGGALGLSSIALAGWPLHVQFLETVSLVTRTVLVTPVSFSLDPLIGQLFFIEHMPLQQRPEWSRVNVETASDRFGHIFMAKTPIWSGVSTLLMIASMLFGAWALKKARRADARGDTHGWIWAFAMGLYALMSPLSWSYHYIAIAAFAPQFLYKFGTKKGALIIASILLPVLLPSTLLYRSFYNFFGWPFMPQQAAGTLAMGLLVVSCGVAARIFSKVDHV